jgi:multisubunit Na+/H+ antiporter MnhC subunit
MVYGLCFGLFLVGLYGVLVKRSLLKIIVGLGIMQGAAILFIVMLGYNAGGGGDPVARELALVAFLAAAAVIAVAATLARRLRAKHGSYDIKDLNRFKE